jgi:ELWxxDGT repeat protein
VNGRELWKSDGTVTVLVKDINPGPASGFPFPLVDRMAALGGTLIFGADNGATEGEL